MAREWKGPSRNIGKPRKQGRLHKKYILQEFDKMPQLELSYVRIRQLQNIVESEYKRQSYLIPDPGNTNHCKQEVIMADKENLLW